MKFRRLVHDLGFNGLSLSMKIGGAFLFSLFSISSSFTQVSSLSLNSNSYKLFLQGKFSPDTMASFVLVPENYTNKAGIYLQKDALSAFILLSNQAKKDGIHLIILSATRNFVYQKGIWERKWGSSKFSSYVSGKARAQAILSYSAMPGTSRHHWGTDIDLNSLSNSYFNSGEGEKVYKWLQLNAPKYGFCQVYSKKDSSRPDGYEEERWHWSYLPLAKNYMTDYSKFISSKDFFGFHGSECFTELEIAKKYVLGINKKCY